MLKLVECVEPGDREEGSDSDSGDDSDPDSIGALMFGDMWVRGCESMCRRIQAEIPGATNPKSRYSSPLPAIHTQADVAARMFFDISVSRTPKAPAAAVCERMAFWLYLLGNWVISNIGYWPDVHWVLREH
jgi:ammonia channel protein AmtB